MSVPDWVRMIDAHAAQAQARLDATGAKPARCRCPECVATAQLAFEAGR